MNVSALGQKSKVASLAAMAALFTNSMGGNAPRLYRNPEASPGTPRDMGRAQFLKRKRKNKIARMSRRKNRG